MLTHLKRASFSAGPFTCQTPYRETQLQMRVQVKRQAQPGKVG